MRDTARTMAGGIRSMWSVVRGFARLREAGLRARACLPFCLLVCLLFAGLAQAAPPVAGSSISNTAKVSYTVPSSGLTITDAPSNTVNATVTQVAAFTLTSTQTKMVAVNTQVVFSHTLTNTGNGPDSFVLSFQSPGPGCAPCSYTLQNPALSPDILPQNGVPDDGGAPTLTTPMLAPGQTYTFVLFAQVPATVLAGQSTQAEVRAVGSAATAAAGGYTAAAQQINTDQATVGGGAVLNLSKSFSISSGPSPGISNVTVTLGYVNNSAVPAANVLIQDWIGVASPIAGVDTTGLRYAGAAHWNGCTSATFTLSDAPDSFEAGCSAAPNARMDYQFAAGATAGTGVVTALINSVPAGGSGTIKFDIQVAGGLSNGATQTTNGARISYCDNGTCGGTQNQVAPSNNAVYTVAAVSGIDLTMTKTVSSPASGNFSIGNPGVYTLQVGNVGPSPSVGTVTVTDTLPGGLEITSISASGWTCNTSGAYTTGNNSGGGMSVTCTSANVVPAAVSSPGLAAPIRINVVPHLVTGVLTVPASSATTVTNTAQVSGGGEPAANNGNNSSSVAAQVTIGATITGRVWQDIPTVSGQMPNRLYDPGIDNPLGGWKVEVLDPTSLTVVASAFTASSGATQGQYTVANLAPGNYYLQFRDPSSNVVNGTPTCANTAAAANPAAVSGGATGVGTGSYNAANCQVPTGGAAAGQASVLDPTGRYLRITLQGGETIIDQNLPLDPSGIVYDASTGQPVAGAVVTIAPRVPPPGYDPSTDFVGGVVTYTTGANGFYQFLLTFSGQNKCAAIGGCVFELGVTPPSGYQPFSVSTTLFPPSPSTGTCTAPNCADDTVGVGFLDASGSNISVPPIPTTSKYYLRFLISNNPRQVINNHFPLVPNSASANNLLVQKKANRTDAEQGDFVDYTVTVLNNTVVGASPATVTDRLPAGFKYVSGSTRFTAPGTTTAVAAPDPQGGAGPVLTFNIGTLAAGQSASVTYRTKLSINAPLGDGKNLASARAPGLGSNTAVAVVKVRGGVFTDKGYIVGTVFLDCNRDRVQGEREPGIPGVRLFMEDGTTVITDSEGKYSLYGVSPRTHVMKIDNITLPKGAEMIALNNRNAGVGDSRFVDVTVGEMARADFAEGSCAPEVLAEVKARRAKGETGAAELNRMFSAGINNTITAVQAPALGTGATSGSISTVPTVQPTLGASITGAGNSAFPPPAVVRPDNVASGGANVFGIPGVTAPASGTMPAPDASRDPGLQASAVPIYRPLDALGAAGSVNSSNSSLPPRTGDLTDAQLPDVAVAPTVAPNLEDLLPTFTPDFAILDLKDGDVMPMAQVNIRMKGAFGTRFVLTVNGDEVPSSRVGKRSTMEGKGTQAWEFIGVNLKKGENVVVGRQIDPFGNLRGEQTVKLVAPGTLAKMAIELPDSAEADGTTPVLVKVRLLDDQGTPVTTRTAVTLSTNLGRFDVPDLNAAEPGTQVFITGGNATFRLVPSSDPGDATVTVVGGNLREQKKMAFLPFLRPLTGAGIIEGAFSLNSLSLKNMVSTQARDGFEQQIQRFSYTSGDGKRTGDARAALFLKGKILGQYLLTMAYDSDKDLKDRVFRDINPDEFYPIYGDASVRGFDAQTTGRFYVRVDKGRSFVLYGDFGTASNVPARQLSQYSRALTGAKGHLEGEKYQLNGFAARDTFRQLMQEFPADGTSGPFRLNLPPGAVINSDRVDILTRDRNQPALILSTTSLTRFSDYSIDPYAGTLLFKGPVASLDANLNPQTIRVTYEVDQGGSPFWVGGVDGQYKLTDKIEIGGMYVKDQNPGAEFSMGGVNATVKITDKTILVGEMARTDRKAPAVTFDPTTPLTANAVGTGNAERLELRHSDGRLDGRLYWGRTDATFDNPSSTLNRGREEAGGRATYKLTPSTALTAEALHTGDVTTGAKTDAISLRVDQSFANGIRVELGVRNVRQENVGAISTVDPTTGAATSGASLLSTGYTSVRGKVTVPIPGLPQASAYGEYEQSVQGDDRKVAAVGGEYKFSQLGRLYGRIESNTGSVDANGAASTQKNNIAVLGIDTSLTKDTKVFSEYRARDTLDGAASEAALGLRNGWQIADGLRLNTSFERVQPFTKVSTPTGTATTSSEATAVTGALEYTANPLWKGSTRLEVRNSDTSTSYLSTVALAYKLSRDWSLLARSTWAYTEMKATGSTSGGEQERARFQVGAAYRDTDTNRWNAITRYEHQIEKDTTIAPILKRAVDIASLHFNYQPERSLILTGRFAAKYVNEESGGLLSKSYGTLVSGRATYDITSRWDVGIVTSLHTDGGFSNRKIGLGLEVGYMVQENLWMSAGYNFFGFKDKDLQGADYTDRGVYVRMRYKFDENLFDWRRDAKLRGEPEEKKP